MTPLFRFLSPALLLLAVVGCSSVTEIPQKAVRTKIRSYEIGKVLSAAVGDPIVSVQSADMVPAYEVVKDYSPPQYDFWKGGHDFPPLKQGTRFEVLSTRSDSTLRIASKDYQMFLDQIRLAPTDPAKSWMQIEFIITPGGVMTTAPLNGGRDWTTDTLFRKSPEGIIHGGAFKAEIVYSGLVGNTIKALYREYVNDLARPAYTTDLQYNLDQSKIIAYRSIKIEVVKATNTAIEFKVLSDDDLPWVK